MALDTAIEAGKEKRKKYFGKKAIDPTCRNHGSCGCCKAYSEYKAKKKQTLQEEFLLEYESKFITEK